MQTDNKWRELENIINIINNDASINVFFDLYKIIIEHFDLNNSNEILYSSIRLDKKRIHLTIGSSYIVSIERRSDNIIIGCCVQQESVLKLKEIYNDKITVSPLSNSSFSSRIWIELLAKDFKIRDFEKPVIDLAKENMKQEKAQFRTMYSEKHNNWILEAAINKEIRNKIMEKEIYLIKKIKKQDLNGEFYIPKKYLGKDKLFPSPIELDPNPKGNDPHIVKINIVWFQIDHNPNGSVLKTYSDENHSNIDTRLTKTPLGLTDDSIVVIKKDKLKGEDLYEITLYNSTHKDYIYLLTELNKKSYKLVNRLSLSSKIASDPKYFFLKAKSERWDCDAIDIVPIGYKQAYSRQNDKTGNFHPFFGNEEKDMKLGDKIILYQTEGFRSVYGFMEVIDINNKEINLELKEKSKKRITLNELREIPILKDITIIMNKQMGNIAALSKDQYLSIYNINFNKMNLNTILYGPPGTGKTYSTITKALDIIGVKYTGYKEAQKLFQNELGKRIEFVTMHQSFSYEDFVQGLKPKENKNGDGILFKQTNGVFKEICNRVDEFNDQGGLEERIEISREDKLIIGFFISKYNGRAKANHDANRYLGKDSWSDVFKFISNEIGVKINTVKAYRDHFDYKFNHRNGYAPNGKEISIGEGLEDLDPPFRKVYEDYSNKNFEELCEIVSNILKSSEKLEVIDNPNKNFVIILDEINRANISRVFGELIALIEEDKRDGKLSATLPSGDSFTVPSNLHIIGTMNTADKSIALVDIALRRRFKFVAMYPNIKTLETVLKEKGMSEDEINLRVHILKNLNRIIRLKKSVDFEIGHSYFMSNDDLVDIMNDQVIPLLNEYFMYDLRVVKELLEKQQKDKEGNKIPRIGIEFDVNEFKERGLLKVNSVDNAKIVEVNDQIDEDISSEEEN